MGKRVWLNWGLLFIALGLALVVYFEPKLGESEPMTAMPLSSRSMTTAQEIRFEVRGQSEVQLQRRGERWWLQWPQRVPASLFQLSRLFELINAESVKRYEVGALALSSYGLEPPEVSLWVDGEAFLFGALSPVNYRRYVWVGGVLHLIDKTDLSIFDRGWIALVDLQLLPKGSKLESLSIPALGELVNYEGRWQLRGREVGVSADALVALVEQWSHARAFKVSPYKKVDDAETVTVKLAGEMMSVVFQLAEEGDEWLLGRSDLGIQYHLTAEQAQRLLSFTVDD